MLTWMGITLVAGYVWWLYKNRAVGVKQLLVAPLMWLSFFGLVWITKTWAFNNPVVSGYNLIPTHESFSGEFWYPDEWEVEYVGEDFPLFLASCSPLLGWVTFRLKLSGPNHKTIIRHFIWLGVFLWLPLILTAFVWETKCYSFNKSSLPAIGSRVTPDDIFCGTRAYERLQQQKQK